MNLRRKELPFNARLDIDILIGTLMICDICGARAARVVKRNKVFGKGRKMIVIENIPFLSCQNCGQTYITRDVMLTVDKIRTHSEAMTAPKEVAYAKIA